jgi:hypothetical protein
MKSQRKRQVNTSAAVFAVADICDHRQNEKTSLDDHILPLWGFSD